MAEATLTDPAKAADGRQSGRPLAVDLVDRRTRAWRRRCEVEAAYIAALGGEAAVDAVMANRVSMAAELYVAAEMARARYLAGEAGATIDDVVRADNAARRAEKALGLDAARAKAAKGRGAFAAFNARHAARKAAQGDGGGA